MSDEEPIDRAIAKWEEAKKRGDSAGQHIARILSAGIGLADPIAGAFASLVSSYIPSRRLSRLEEFAEQIAADLRRLSSRLDTNYIQSDEYAYLFEHCFRGAAENYQRDKLQSFRGILVNSPIRKDIGQEEKEYFLSLVNTLTSVHLRVLQYMADPGGYLAVNGIDPSAIRGGFNQSFPAALPGVSLEIIKAAFTDLHGLGFTNTPPSIFSTMTSAQGIQLVQGRVTDFGLRFITFCRVPE
jgi:hypothetical protein